jgi:hypothetical protein
MIGMGAKSITIVRAVTADFFFDCRAAEVHSDSELVNFGKQLLKKIMEHSAETGCGVGTCMRVV